VLTETVAVEIVQTLVGSIGLVASVPVATAHGRGGTVASARFSHSRRVVAGRQPSSLTTQTLL